MSGDDGGRLNARRRALLKGLGVGAAATATGALAYPHATGLLSGGNRAELGAAQSAMQLVPTGEATHTASEGVWQDDGTWTDGVPGAGARVHVPTDTTVTLDHEDAARLQWVRVDGTLRTDPATASALSVDTLVITDRGTLEIGTPESPDVGGTTLTFVDRGAIDTEWDPERISRGLIAVGGATIRIAGAEKRSYVGTASAAETTRGEESMSAAEIAQPAAGDSTLALAREPTGWEVGDTIVVAGTNPERDEDEERTIQSVTGSEVTLETPLENDHTVPAADLSTYVANLDRSVTIRSETTAAKRRGHLMFMSPDTDLRHVAFEELGRTEKARPFTNPDNGVPPSDVPPNPKARYVCHFHRIGIDASVDPARVEGCVARGSPGWGYVNHNSHVEFVENVSYRVFGAGFVAEVGNEIGGFRRNFALRSVGSGGLPDSRQFHEDDEGDIDDFGHGGYGFWFQGPGTEAVGNVAAGHRHYGFVFWCRAKPDQEVEPEQIGGTSGEFPNYPLDNVPDQPYLAEADVTEDGRVPSSYVRIRKFTDNTVFASGGGLDMSRHRLRDDPPDDAAPGEYHSVLEGFTAFNVGTFSRGNDSRRPPRYAGSQGGNNGLTIRYSAHVTLRDVRLLSGRGDGRGIGVNHNEAPYHVHIDGGEIRGWTTGVRSVFEGEVPIRNVAFDNDVDVQLTAGGTDHHWRSQQSELSGVTFADGGRAEVFMGTDLDDDLYGLFSPESVLSLDGDDLYLESQKPGFVPIPTSADVADVDEDALGELTNATPSELVGKTNRTLWNEFGISVEGEPLPPGAGRRTGLARGVVDGGGGRSAPDRLIDEVQTATGAQYEVGELAQGERLYVYDDDRFLAVPGRYTGLEYVRFEKEDAGGDRRSFAYVTLAAPARLYVAYDSESTPDWIGPWSGTGDALGTTDETRTVYQTEVDAGTTVLGPAADTHRMYTVFAEPR